MPHDVITVAITALLSAGSASFFGTLLRGVGRLRSGAWAREREAVANLARTRDEAEKDRDYWRRIAGRYAYQLERANIEPNPANPIPPSEDARNAPRGRPRRSGAP